MYDVAALRDRIPALASGIAFFDGPGGSQTPAEVAAAIASALTSPLSNRGTGNAAARNAEAIVVHARAAIADLLGAEPGGIVFGRSMTQLAYDLARAVSESWSAGEEIIVTRLDHDAHIRPWVQAAQRAGVNVQWADFDRETGELATADIAAVFTERTRLVAVTGASNLVGSRPPLREIAELVHSTDALLSVDGVHLTAHAPIDVAEIDADFFFCSPYKFLGPHCGVLCAEPELLEQLHPDKLLPSPDTVPERFELGTLPYELLAGVAAAVDVIASLAAPATSRRERVLAAMTMVEEHEDALRVSLEAGLAALPGVVQRARAPQRTPTLLLTFDGRAPADVAAGLAERSINAPAGSFYALEASRQLGLGDVGGLRVGLAPYSSADDVARLLEGLSAVLA